MFQFGRPHNPQGGRGPWARHFQVLDVHRYIAAKFDTAAASDFFATHAKAAKPVFGLEVGGGEATPA